jgi:P-type Mg2+ transporter
VPATTNLQPLSLSSLLAQLRTSVQGLTSAEATQRLRINGPNDPTSTRGRGLVVQLLSYFASPLVVILLLASAISAALGDLVNSTIIVVIVLLSIALNFAQTYRSQQAVERLRTRVAPTATVRRDGLWVERPRRELVPGDIIRLAAGDLVPADARLMESRDLHIHQAALTGESLPAEKEAGDFDQQPSQPGEARNLVFLGTSVVSGTATAVVSVTGRATVFGDIAQRLATRPPETEFERGTRQFSLFIVRTVFFLVLFVFLTTSVLRHNTLESLLFAVALAVGLTPEFLPMITTVTLARGAVHMARAKAVVKHLESIQNFGSIDVLCSDKTGTLTSGVMTLEQYLDPSGQPADRVLSLAYLNSYFETGIKGPLDEAILRKGKEQLPETAAQPPGAPEVQGYRKLDEIPFDFERRRLSVVVARDDERLLIMKGAPEAVLALCTACELSGPSEAMDAAVQARCQATHQDLAAKGYYVLAVASRAVPPQDAYRVADERDLTLAGFIAFVDPPLEDARSMLEAMRADGVEVKILTGDSELVVRHVCTQVGIDPGHIVRGDELDQISDAALPYVAEQTTIFARVSPAQKNRVILALKRRSHVVGFLGDGINDAPSLHAADVGISVASAVDVAKDAADIILLERDLRVLHNGIVEGRKAFGNVIKYLLMGTSSNFGNMFSMAGAAVFLPFLPMLPTQILLNNFLYDLSQVTIPTDHVDDTFTRKPRHWDIGLIRDFMLFIGPISSLYDFLTFYVMLNVFHAGEALFHTGWFVESLATQTLVIFVIRSAGNPLRSRPSAPLALTVSAIVIIGMLLPFTPVASLLGFVPLPATFFVFLAGATLTYLLLVEVAKRRLLRRLFN